jgi:DNA gyrase subunit A
MGVRNIVTDARAGSVVGSMAVSDDDEIIVMSESGIVIRTKVSEISIQKRNTRGVWVMRPDEGDRVIGFTILDSGEDGEAS